MVTFDSEQYMPPGGFSGISQGYSRRRLDQTLAIGHVGPSAEYMLLVQEEQGEEVQTSTMPVRSAWYRSKPLCNTAQGSNICITWFCTTNILTYCFLRSILAPALII